MSNSSGKAIPSSYNAYDDAQVAHFLFENSGFTSSGLNVSKQFSSSSSSSLSTSMAVVPSLSDEKKAVDEFGEFESNFFFEF